MIIHLDNVGGGGGGDHVTITENTQAGGYDIKVGSGTPVNVAGQSDLLEKADKDGVISFAKDIVSREDGIGAEFIRRRSAGQLHIGDGSAFIRSIKGKTVVWNQLVKNGNFSDTSEWSIREGAFSVANHIATLTQERATFTNTIYQDRTFVANHTYLISVVAKKNQATTTQINVGLANGFTSVVKLEAPLTPDFARYSTIVTLTQSAGRLAVSIASYTTGELLGIDFQNLQVIDLTQMFGAGNEPSTPEEFEALFPASYYPYNEGELINLKATKLLTNGFNQWDEEWEVGGLSAGLPVPSDQQIRSKNFCPCLPSTDYFLYARGETEPYWVLIAWYDMNYQFIQQEYRTNLITNSPVDARYFKISTNASYYIYGTTYNHDICINFSNASLNGQYKPYEQHELTLPAGLTKTYTGADGQTHTWQGLDSAGAACDEQTPTKNIQRIGVVDLGTLNWSLYSTYNLFVAQFIDTKNSGNGRGRGANCSIYSDALFSNFVGWANFPDKTIAAGTNFIGSAQADTTIVIKDSAYTDAASFKAAMAGVLLLYELAEPIETDVPARNFNYFVSDMGEEWILPEGVDEQGVPLTAPFNAVIAYASNVRDTIFHLPENYLSKESTIALLEAMKSANIIASYTMTFDAANNKYTFTVVEVEKANKIPRASSIPSGGILPDVFYALGEISSDPNITLAANPSDGKDHEYMLSFSTGATAPSAITFPASVVFPSTPSWEANKHYEISAKWDATTSKYYATIQSWDRV